MILELIGSISISEGVQIFDYKFYHKTGSGNLNIKEMKLPVKK